MTALLDLEQQMLIRAWIQGVPLAALDLDPDYPALAELAECRTRLHLKALRLDWPDPGLWLQRRPGPDWQRTALHQLDLLLRHTDLLPLLDQPLRFWVAPEMAECLVSAQLATVGDVLLRCQRDGKAWWQTIPGLGRTGARRIEASLELRFPGKLTKAARQNLLLYETGLVPLERLLVPDNLDGSQGRNRAPATPFIPMPHDLAAIQAWLALFDPNSHTHRSYQREAERLLLWAILDRHKALSSLDATDLADYRRFLQDPQPAELWIGPPQHKNHPHWKPFTGPLSRRSAKHAETLLNSLFTFLLQQRYLQHNPLSALPKLKDPDAGSAIGIHRAFTSVQWAAISTAIESLVRDSSGQERRKWLRTRLTLHLGYATGLRLHELAQARIGDLVSLNRGEHTQHWLKVLGKGQKRRQVPLPPAVFSFIGHTYQQLTGQALLRQDPAFPLLPDLNDKAKAVTPLAIHKVMKDFFGRVAEQIRDDNPEAAAHLAKASSHWLRHTHGTMAVDSAIPLTAVRDNMGHASISTTSHYLHSDADARYDAFRHFAEPPPIHNHDLTASHAGNEKP